MKYLLFAVATVIACSGWSEVSAEVTAKFSVSPRKGNKGTNFEFDAGKSKGAITSYSWDFGDGTTGTGKTVEHKFKTDGKFKVVLTVDDGQSTDGRKKTVRVIKPGSGGGGGGEDGQKCSYTNPRRDVWFFKVISHDPNKKTIIGEFEEPATCGDVFYLCGDVRIGGIRPGQKEYWIGTICEMWNLGNNRFRLHLVDGKYWVDTGETGTYVWPQYDCVPSVACDSFGY